MTTQEVANRMKVLLAEKNWNQVQVELYAADCFSVEPENSFGLKNVRGIDAIKEKGNQFSAIIETVHGSYVSELLTAGNFITCTMGWDITIKNKGRIQLDEVAVYEVKAGKIIKEQFFY